MADRHPATREIRAAPSHLRAHVVHKQFSLFTVDGGGALDRATACCLQALSYLNLKVFWKHNKYEESYYSLPPDGGGRETELQLSALVLSKEPSTRQSEEAKRITKAITAFTYQ